MWCVALVVVLGAIVWIYEFTARQAVDGDPFIYAALAKDVLAGKRLYLDVWQDKPPLGILMYALPQLFVPRSYSAVMCFSAVLIATQAALFAYAFRRHKVAALGAAMFIAVFPLTEYGYSWPSTEHFANLFVTGNVLIALSIYRRQSFTLAQCFAVGAFACAAFHIRQNIVLCGVIPGLAVLVTPVGWADKLKGIGAMVAGALVGWLLILGLVLRFCDWREYFWTVFVYPRAYAAIGSMRDVIDLAIMLWRGSLPFVIVFFAGVAAASRQYRWLVVSALVVGLASCVLPMRAYIHYWGNCFPYVALLIGLGLERLERDNRPLAWVSMAALAIAFIPTAGVRVQLAYKEPSNWKLERVAAAVDRAAPAGANLMVCGPMCCESIQFASRLPAANKFSWVSQFQPLWRDILPESLDNIFADYVAHPPDVIAIEHNHLKNAMANFAPDAPDYLRLMRALFDTHEYKIVDNLEGYVIAVRQGD
ncbi:MAG: hypothetical protein HYX69_04740 [Planctomycetia bacterium]|nr:hypothetical protein [Planctomycetia bacterium]